MKYCAVDAESGHFEEKWQVNVAPATCKLLSSIC